MVIETKILILIFFVSLILHFFGAVSGGIGGLLRSFMIILGVLPSTTIATASATGLITKLVGLNLFHKKDKIDWKLSFYLMIPSLIGGVIGGYLVISLDENLIQKIIGIFILISVIVLIIKKDIGTKERKIFKNKFTRELFAFPTTVLLNIYGTVIGGVGPLFTLHMIFTYGKTYITTAPIRKISSYIRVVMTTAIFVYSALVDWYLFIVLIVSGTIGTHFGTHFSLKKGENFVKITTLVLMIFASIKLILF